MPALPRRQHAPRTDEGAIQQQIRLAIGSEPDLLLFRNAQAFAEVWDPDSGDVRHVRGGLGVGTPDLVGLLGPSGRFVGLEIKSAMGRLRPEQRAIAELIRRRGGFVAEVRSVEEARAAIARARRGLLA